MASLDERVAYLEGRLEDHTSTVISLRDDMRDRFDGVDERFERVDERFDRIDRRLDRLDDRLSRHFTWLVGIQVAVLIAVLGALLGR